MDKFIKRNTIREIEILGNEYNVDFGRDEIPFIFSRVAVEMENNVIEDIGEELERQKKIFEVAINDIISNNQASTIIFQDDKTAVLHSDVYAFLLDCYTKTMNDNSPYSQTRLSRS